MSLLVSTLWALSVFSTQPPANGEPSPAGAEQTPAGETPPTAEAPSEPAAAATVESPQAQPSVPASAEPKALDSAFLDDPSAGAEAAEDQTFLDLNLVDLMSADIKVVSAARGSAASLNEAPAIIEVITANDLRLWGYQSTAEALHRIVGFYMVDPHSFPEVGVRGASGGQFGQSSILKVMIDGRAITQRADNSNPLGPDLVPLSAINRIEVIRGPASAMYGADAFMGVVNVITYKGDEINGATLTPSMNVLFPRGEGANIGGGFDGAVGLKKGPVSFMMAGKTLYEDRSGLKIPSSSSRPQLHSYSSRDDTANMVQRSNTGYVRIDADVHKKAQLGVYGYIGHYDRPDEFYAGLQMSNRLDVQGRQKGTVTALVHGTTGVVLDVQPTETSNIKFDVRYFFARTPDRDRLELPNIEDFHYRRTADWDGGEAVLEGSWSITEKINVAAGAEVNAFYISTPAIRRHANFDIPESGLEAGDPIEPGFGSDVFYNAGAFAQLTYTPFKKYLTLTGGFRYDYNKFYQSQYSGRVAAVSNPLDWLTIKVMYGRAFKAPSPVTLTFESAPRLGALIGNPNLKPQYVDTVEGQLSFRYKGFLKATTGVAYNYVTDFVTISQIGINLFPVNVSETSALTWESELKASYKSWVGGYASFEINRSVTNRGDASYINLLSGDRGEIYPMWIVRGGVFGQVPKVPLRLSANLMVVGPRNASNTNAFFGAETYTLGTYPLLGATLSTVGLEMLKGRETIVSVTARNLLNEVGPDPGFSGIDNPLTPLSLIFSLTQKL